MHVINLFTIPHTGLKTLQEFLLKFKFLHDIPLEVLGKNELMFEHGEKQGLIPTRHNLVSGQINGSNIEVMKMLSHHWPMVIPLRDPLLTMISAKNQDPTTNCSHIVRSWIYFLEELYEFDPFIMPIDTLRHPEDRYTCIKELLTHLTLNWSEDSKELCEEFADKWPESNAHGAYPLKTAYYNRDIKYIERNMEKEFQALQVLTPIFRPFLESYGYEDLLWFDSATEQDAA